MKCTTEQTKAISLFDIMSHNHRRSSLSLTCTREV